MPDLAIAFTDGSTQEFKYDPELTSPPATLVVVPVQPGPAPAAAAPAAPATPQQPAVQTVAPLVFEGAQVGMKEIKISGQCTIEADMDVSMDDLVRAVGVYRVVGVRFYVHKKTGETVRQNILSPVETLVVVPFDSSNPNDDGIVRARPLTP